VPFIGAEHRDRLYDYMGGIIRKERGLLLEVGGMPDHVHLLARFRASVSLSEMLKLIKGRSSHWMNGLPDLGYHFDWQEGYAALGRIQRGRPPRLMRSGSRPAGTRAASPGFQPWGSDDLEPFLDSEPQPSAEAPADLTK
jgi:hypothetical protein